MKKIGILLLLLTFTAGTMVWSQTRSSDSVATKTDKYTEYKDAFNRIDPFKLPGVIAAIEKERAETEQKKIFWESTKTITGLGAIFPFLMVILIVFTIQYFRYKKKKDLYFLITKFVDSGKEVPIDLLMEPKIKRSDLRRGLIFSGLGLAIMIGAIISTNKSFFTVSLIPIFLGIAYIISHFSVRSKEN